MDYGISNTTLEDTPFEDTTPFADTTPFRDTTHDFPRYSTSDIPSVDVSSSSQLHLRDESWVIPLLSMSSINLIAIILFEIYVLYKSCGTRRHLLLGQILLFALFLCSFIGYSFTLTPHWLICGVTRFGIGLLYVLVFATLLVKLLFLIVLNSGTYMNSAYQSLLIFFAVGVQVAISVQWLYYRPPELTTSEEVPQRDICAIHPIERIQYLSYAMFLLLAVCIAAIRARTLKENNKEAKYIGASAAFLVIIWVAWMSVVIIFDRRYEDPALGFGIVWSSIVVFLLVFVPKAVQLSLTCRKNGSTMGSQSMVFAPSFLHLQPHSVLPSTNGNANNAVIKHPSSTTDYCRGYASRVYRYDYPAFCQMEPLGTFSIQRSSTK